MRSVSDQSLHEVGDMSVVAVDSQNNGEKDNSGRTIVMNLSLYCQLPNNNTETY